MERLPGSDVVVIGAGIAGCATAMLLAEAGMAVTVIDRGAVAGEASGLNAGMIDSTGAPDLKTGGLELFRTLHERGFDIGFRQSGCLTLAATEDELAWARDQVAAAQAAGHRLELLDGDDARALEPAIARGVFGAIHAPLAAQADPVPATQAFATAADRAGAAFRLDTEVVDIDVIGPGLRLSTTAGSIDADRLVIAAGPWCAELGARIGVEVPIVAVRGQMWAVAGDPGEISTTIAAVESARHFDIDPGSDPPHLTHRDGARVTRHLYGRQRVDGEIVFGGDRVLTTSATPDSGGIAANREHVEGLLPDLAGRPTVRTWAGLMPFSLDGDPVIGARGPAGVYVVGGLASSGFNRGPGAARVLVDEILADG